MTENAADTLARSAPAFLPESVRILEDILGDTLSIGIGHIEHPTSPSTIVSLVAGKTDPGTKLENPDAIVIDEIVDADIAVVIPLLAAALRIIEDSKLDLGEGIVVCGSCSFSKFFIEAASWWTPSRVCLTSGENDGAGNNLGLDTIRITDDDSASKVRNALAQFPSAVIVDFDGRAESWELFLGAAPYWTTLMACAPRTERMTVDFYNDVHRKGMSILGMPLTAEGLFSSVQSPADSAHIKRAREILNDRVNLDRFLGCLGFSQDNSVDQGAS